MRRRDAEAGRALGIDAMGTDAKLALEVIPPVGPGLLDTALLLENGTGSQACEHGEGHGDAMVVVAVDTNVGAELTVVDAKDLEAILVLFGVDAELGELVHHGTDAVALLDALVCDAGDARRRASSRGGAVRRRLGSDGEEDRGSEEGVGHRLHVDQANLAQVTDLGSNDGGGCGGLDDGAAHGLEHLLGEAGVTLERGGADVGDGALGARDGGDGQRVGGTAGVALDVVDGGRDVAALGDAVGVGEAAGGRICEALDLDAEGGHHGDSHVDVKLRDDLTADELEHDLFGGVGRAEEDGRDVLGRDGGRELDLAALKAAGGSLDGERQAALALEVVDRGAVGSEGVDEGTDGALLHALVAGDDDGILGAVVSDEGDDGGHEACSGTCVLEVDVLVVGGATEVAVVAMDDDGLSSVLELEASGVEVCETGHHDLGVVRVKHVAESAGVAGKSSEDERAVGDGFGAWSGEGDLGVVGLLEDGRDGGAEGENAADDVVADGGGHVFDGVADGVKKDDLLVGARVLLVDLHDVEEAVDGDVEGLGKAGDAGVGERDREVVLLEAASEATDGDLAEAVHVARDLCLEDHADGDALAVEHLGGEDGLDGVADRVAKVDKVAKAALLFVDGDDVRLDADGAADDVEQERLGFGARVEGPALVERGVGGEGPEDGGADGGSAGLELGKVDGVPDGGCLDHLSHAVAELSGREGLEPGSVDEDVVRLVEAADEVLAERVVDGGLAADGRVDHGEEGGGDLDKLETTHEGGCDEADEVANHTAADGEYDSVASDAVLEHPVLDVVLALTRLGALARRDDLGEEPPGVGGVEGVGGLFELSAEGGGDAASGLEVLVGDEDVGGGGEGSQKGLCDVRDEVVAEMDGGVEAAEGVDGGAREFVGGWRGVVGGRFCPEHGLRWLRWLRGSRLSRSHCEEGRSKELAKRGGERPSLDEFGFWGCLCGCGEDASWVCEAIGVLDAKQMAS
ncbi:hypothetical protein L1887_50669 [Cichorium endivia]|nr:hypothetical protein L1887_50669 [Cichorium endivia]